VGLSSEGDLYAWGVNADGQLGLGDVTPRSSPVAVLGGLKFTDVIPTSAGSFLALTKTGEAYAWGDNTFGQLGDNSTDSKSSPVAVLGGLQFSRIISGNGSVIGLELGTGVAYAWGRNASGVLGLGD